MILCVLCIFVLSPQRSLSPYLPYLCTIQALYILRQVTFPFPFSGTRTFHYLEKKKKGSSVFMYHNNNCVPGAAISVVLMVYAGSYCDGQVLKEATRRRGFDNRKLA